MKLISIFANHIWSIKYDSDSDDVFTKLLDDWQNVEYLYNFFDYNWNLVIKSDIWKKYTKKDLIMCVREEAKYMQSYFLKLYKNSQTGNRPDFDKLFTSLGAEDAKLYNLYRCKAYGSISKPAILRLYAIQVETNAYVITGGGIKLTKTMNECKYLENEIEHLNQVQKWFKNEGIESKLELKELK